jgi:hypothetical protein
VYTSVGFAPSTFAYQARQPASLLWFFLLNLKFLFSANADVLVPNKQDATHGQGCHGPTRCGGGQLGIEDDIHPNDEDNPDISNAHVPAAVAAAAATAAVTTAAGGDSTQDRKRQSDVGYRVTVEFFAYAKL